MLKRQTPIILERLLHFPRSLPRAPPFLTNQKKPFPLRHSHISGPEQFFQLPARLSDFRDSIDLFGMFESLSFSIKHMRGPQQGHETFYRRLISPTTLTMRADTTTETVLSEKPPFRC